MKLRTEFVAWYFNEFSRDPLFQLMDGMSEDSPWHRESSIGIHTNMVVGEYLSRTDENTIEDEWLIGAFACAFHDVGKPGACEFKWKEERGDYKSFNGHELLSARLWEDWAVRNWNMLSTRFEFEVEDIYRVAWLIEYHKPWDLKNPTKLRNLSLTATVATGADTFRNMVTADTWGRLSDDFERNRAKVREWLAEMHDRNLDCMADLQPTDWPIATHSPEEDQPMLYVPIGASGTGKSTLYNTMCPDAHSYSWDALRLEWYDADDYEKAFAMSCDDKQFMNRVNSEFQRLVNTGEDIYVDNTNTSAKRRRFFVDTARRKGYYVMAVLMPVSLGTVIDRQISRNDKTVPVHAVERQYNNVQMPQLGEFDLIVVESNNL